MEECYSDIWWDAMLLEKIRMTKIRQKNPPWIDMSISKSD